MEESEIKLDLSDAEADELLNAACSQDEVAWTEQFG